MKLKSLILMMFLGLSFAVASDEASSSAANANQPTAAGKNVFARAFEVASNVSTGVKNKATATAKTAWNNKVTLAITAGAGVAAWYSSPILLGAEVASTVLVALPKIAVTVQTAASAAASVIAGGVSLAVQKWRAKEKQA